MTSSRCQTHPGPNGARQSQTLHVPVGLRPSMNGSFRLLKFSGKKSGDLSLLQCFQFKVSKIRQLFRGKRSQTKSPLLWLKSVTWKHCRDVLVPETNVICFCGNSFESIRFIVRRLISKTLWGSLSGKSLQSHKYGKYCVSCVAQIVAVLLHLLKVCRTLTVFELFWREGSQSLSRH